MNVMTYVAAGVGVVVVLIVIFFVKWIFSLRRVVPTNEVHIVRRGKNTMVYGTPERGNAVQEKQFCGNCYYEFPMSIPFLGVTVTQMPLSIFGIDINDYEAFDKERVPFVVDIQSFFRISDYEVAASRISRTDELKRQLLSIVQGAVRSILAKDFLNEIMGERSKYGQQFTDEVKEELKSWGVETVKNIELMDVRDAKGEQVISNIMKKKKSEIEKESRVAVAKNNQEAKEAEIEAQRQIDLKEQEANQQVGLRKAQVAQEVGIADEKATQAVKEQAKLTKEKEMEVKKVETVKQAEIDKEKTVINAEAKKRETEINAEAAKAKAERDADAELILTTKKAEGSLITASKSAEGIKLEGDAKANAEKQMQLASVEAQLKLASEIGNNDGYQHYLIQVRQIEANEKVGLAQADNIKGADIKIIAGAGDVTGGISSAARALSPKGGFNLAGMLASLAATDEGKALLEKLGLKTAAKTE